jgi:hypothetical protein
VAVDQRKSPVARVVLLGSVDALVAVGEGLVVVVVGVGDADGLVNRVPVGEGTAIVGSPARSTGAESARTPNTTATRTTTAPTISEIRPQLGPRCCTPGSVTGSP